jgi:hypothetical protein
MSTTVKEQTALAVRDPAIGNLPAGVQERLQMRRLSNQVAGELAKMNWGSKLDLETRRAVADWGRQFRVDVTTEIHVLGGNVYLNVAFWLRKLSEMIESGIVEHAYADHVEDDPRLKKLGPEGEGEYSRRLRERIMHAIPDAAASAVVFRIKLRSMEKEVVGVKWCGGGTRKSDPVGDAMPVETSESRAARRAMRQLASHVPAEADGIEALEESAEMLSQRVIEAKTRIAEVEAKHNQPRRAIAAGVSSDPYTQVATNEQKARITELLDQADVTDEERVKVATVAGAKDYTAAAADAEIARLEKLVPAGDFSLESEG